MKSFLLRTTNIERDSTFWNMIGSLIMSFQAVFFLMLLTRTVGLTESGIFSIAFANANLFLSVGKYGMRSYQVSDVRNEYNFQEYQKSRWLTTAAMFLISVLHTVYTANVNNYTIDKVQIIIWMCLWKMVDSVEDVYAGEYQKKGRLDVAGKILTIRMFLTIIVFCILIIISRDLLTTLIVSTCFSAVVEILFVRCTYSEFYEKENIRKGKVVTLLVNCLPVALSTFLSYYVLNAPKYAIDAQLSDEIQACYGFISMPVFVISMLNSFIFTPFLHKLSLLWNEGKVKEFVQRIRHQTLIVIGITIICLMGAFLLGIPVLSFLYNTDLSAYKSELLILLVGGGFLAWSGVLNAAIVIIRYQKVMLLCYGITAVLAFFMSNYVVRIYQMMGAAMLYMLLVMFLCLSFLFVLIFGIRKSKDM